MNMPESIINGGSGANHWKERQAKIDAGMEDPKK